MAEWFEGLSQDLAVDVEVNGAQQKVPLREHSFVKESPDLGHFVNKAFAAHRELGSRFPIKKLDKPEEVSAWQKEYLPKFEAAGLITGPPKDIAGYKSLAKPEAMPNGVTWSEERATKFGELGLKHRLSDAAMTELRELHMEAVGGVAKTLETTYEAGQLALKRELGDKYDDVMELCKRFTPTIFKSKEELQFFEDTGISNHPVFLSVMARLAQLAQTDSSFGVDTNGGGAGAANHDELKKELADIQNNPQNPDYKGYWANDPAVHKKINDKYAKLFPGQMVIS